MLKDDLMIFGCDVNKPSPTDKSQNRKHDSNSTESMAAVNSSQLLFLLINNLILK